MHLIQPVLFFSFFISLSLVAMDTSITTRQENRSARPDDVIKAIDSTFKLFSEESVSRWPMNGEATYHIGTVDEEKLISFLVENSKDQQEFYLLDIGAGDFQWGRNMAAFINRTESIPATKKFHIISVRAEKNDGEQVKHDGKCMLYELGRIKVENIEPELERCKLLVSGKFDLIVSRMCFRHLVDPAGTLTRVYNHLLNSKGFLLFDGFYFGLEGDELAFDPNTRLHAFLLKSDVPCLRVAWQIYTSLDHFIIQKGSKPLELPGQYRSYSYTKFEAKTAAQLRMTFFSKEELANVPVNYESNNMQDKSAWELCYGDETLHALFLSKSLYNVKRGIKGHIFHKLAKPAEEFSDKIQERPDDLDQDIDRVFRPLSEQSKSQWNYYNGSSTYHIGTVDEEKLINYLVEKSKDQNDFYLLDIGAGNFQWGRNMAAYINKTVSIPATKKFHIISVRAEKNDAEPIKIDGKCILYELGRIKVENIDQELERCQLLVKGKFDFIISRWCLRHLIDPAGTLTRVYNHLLNSKGFLLFDGFFFGLNGQEFGYYEPNYLLHAFLIKSAVPCIRISYSTTKSLDHFIVKKGKKPLTLPGRYITAFYQSERWQIGSQKVTFFSKEELENVPCNFEDIRVKDYLSWEFCYGDEALHTLLLSNGLYKPMPGMKGYIFHKLIDKKES